MYKENTGARESRSLVHISEHAVSPYYLSAFMILRMGDINIIKHTPSLEEIR
jgi:hypothetical protein